MYNFYREHWLVDRLGATRCRRRLRAHSPCVYERPSTAQQAVHDRGLTAADQTLRRDVGAARRGTPPPATDDRPFLYLEDRTIPSLYLRHARADPARSGLIAARRAIGSAAARVRGRHAVRTRDLFLLGAAFLLLETKSVTGFALLFGTTWVVNALVFAGRAARRARRGRGDPAVPDATAAGDVRRAARRARAGLAGARDAGCWRCRSSRAALVAVAARVPADLRRERHLRQALRRRPPTRRRPSARTCSARWSAAAWSTSRSSSATRRC